MKGKVYNQQVYGGGRSILQVAIVEEGGGRVSYYERPAPIFCPPQKWQKIKQLPPAESDSGRLNGRRLGDFVGEFEIEI